MLGQEAFSADSPEPLYDPKQIANQHGEKYSREMRTAHAA